jgi:parallel beta-helix repeat protein
MKHALQKVFFLRVLGMATFFYAYILSQPSDYSSDTVTYITRGDLSPANAAYTINRSGVYKLTSAKTASGVPNISITANNVVLDLGDNTLTGGTNGIEITGNNVTVKNGTVTGMTQSGVFVQATGCTLNNCDIVSSPTGVTLQNANQCVIENCRVRNATQAGVSLQSTWTSVISSCEVAGVSGTTSVYGVVAQSGGNNSVEQCTVRAVRTSSSTGTDKVVGIVLSDETASYVNGNEIQVIESLTTVSAYGLWVNGGNNATATNNSITQVTTSSGRGQGVFVNQASSYIASNLCYDCDSSFTGVPSEFITSQANARGVYNIDTNLTTPDQIEEIHTDQLPFIESQVDALPAQFSALESVVDSQLAGCVEIPVRAPGTLSASGSYCLADTLNGTLSITGTDITVCLNEHTINGGQLTISGDRVLVSNGTVRNNVSASGVYVTGNNCFLNNIRSIANRTGFEVASAQNNQLMNCSATSCTREGFLLQNCTRTELADCSVQSLVGTGTIAGIKTINGTSNAFNGCSVDGVAATNGDAYGIWGVTEQKSIFTGNNVNDVSVTGGSAKGLALDEDSWLKNSVSFSWSTSTATTTFYVPDLSWLQVQPSLAYLAIAEGAPSNPFLQRVALYRYDGANVFNLCYEQIFSGSVSAVKWLRRGNDFYLAVSWNSPSGVDVKIYFFDVVSETLLSLPNAEYIYDAAVDKYSFAVSWLQLIDGNVFLAIGGSVTAPNTGIRVLSFDGNYLSLVAATETTGLIVSDLDWYVTGSRQFLSVAFNSNDPAFRIYEFNTVHAALDLKASYSTSGVTGGAIRWCKYQDNVYLGVSWSSTPQYTVFLYDVETNTLTLKKDLGVANQSSANDWLITGTTLYATFAGVNPEVNIYRYDPLANSLTAVYTSAFSDAQQSISLQWFTGTQGRALLGVGFLRNGGVGLTREISVLGFDLIGSTTSIVQNNTVLNIVGTGISINELSNPTLSNKVYNATTPYYPWTPYRFDPSNEIVSG